MSTHHTDYHKECEPTGNVFELRSRKSMVVPTLSVIRSRVLQSSGMILCGSTQNLFLSERDERERSLGKTEILDMFHTVGF